MNLTAAQLDRACGAVLGSAVGDALGAAYEFDLLEVGPDGPRMLGGGLGNFAPGEWTDDTAMAWCILDVAAAGADLRTEEALTEIARRFHAWYETGPADMGSQTRAILSAAGSRPSASGMTTAARRFHARTGRSGGNGSLMRTAPVALAHLDDPDAVATAARRISALTHPDPQAQDACVLWSLAIRHAVLRGEFDVRAGLAHLDSRAATLWSGRLTDAERSAPSTFRPNGWVVTALQAAWSAIVHTPAPAAQGCRQLADGLATAVWIGDDTDTVAAIAGALLGARWGASAVPAAWRRISHGYPGLTGERLVELAHLAADGPNPYGWPKVPRIDYPPYLEPPTLVRHPHDPGVWLADAQALNRLPADVTAVVSLCQVGREQVPPGIEHVGFRLIDRPDPDANPNLDFVLTDAAATIAALRNEGHVVLVHCVAAQSRTPTVGIAYSLLRGIEPAVAVEEIGRALPLAWPNPGFREALRRLSRAGEPWSSR